MKEIASNISMQQINDAIKLLFDVWKKDKNFYYW
jgi:hypothetical protein